MSVDHVEVEVQPEPVEETSEPDTYTLREVIDLTGLTYRRVDYWIRCGYLGHDPNDTTPGSGFQRTWHQRDIDVLRHMRTLVDLGLLVPVASVWAQAAVDHGVFDHQHDNGTEIRWTTP